MKYVECKVQNYGSEQYFYSRQGILLRSPLLPLMNQWSHFAILSHVDSRLLKRLEPPDHQLPVKSSDWVLVTGLLLGPNEHVLQDCFALELNLLDEGKPGEEIPNLRDSGLSF
jgi:hypothetical protein